MSKTQNRFGISNFGYGDLFDICDLSVLQKHSSSLAVKPLKSDLEGGRK